MRRMSPPPATSSTRLARGWRTVSISASNGPMESAICFDGRSSRRRDVTLAFADRLVIADSEAPEGAPLAAWPYDSVRRVDGPEDVLRLACTAAPLLARLELRDPAARANILRLCRALDGPGSAAAVSVWRIAAASLAAAAAILGMVWFGMPLIANRLADITPYGWGKAAWRCGKPACPPDVRGCLRKARGRPRAAKTGR